MDRFGIFAWFGYRQPIEQRVRLIREAGYAATSIWLGRQEPLVHEGSADLIPRIIRSSGLAFEYVHASYANCNKLWSADSADRGIIREDYASAIRYCADHEIPTVVMHVVKGMNPPPYGSVGLDTIADLVRIAERGGVRIAIENTRHSAYVDFLLENLESPALGFCYDSSHDFLYSAKPGSILSRWGHRLLVTHLSDNDGLTDKHWLPSLGSGDWSSVAAAFPAAAFRGFLTLEVLPKRDAIVGVEEFLGRGIERLRWFAGLAGVELEEGPARVGDASGAFSERLPAT